MITATPRKERDTLPIRFAAKTMGNKASMEVAIPWKVLEKNTGKKLRKLALGARFGFQLVLTDRDSLDKGVKYRSLWHPKPGAAFKKNRMHRIELSKLPSPPQHAFMENRFDFPSWSNQLTVKSHQRWLGEKVFLIKRLKNKSKMETKVLAEGVFAEASNERVKTTLSVPVAKDSLEHQQLEICVNQVAESCQAVSLPYSHLFKRLPRKKLDALAAKYKLNDPWLSESWGKAQFHANRGYAALLHDLNAGKIDFGASGVPSNVSKVLSRVNTDYDRLIEGKSCVPNKPGDYFWGYYSMADQSGQPFVLTLPKIMLTLENGILSW